MDEEASDATQRKPETAAATNNAVPQLEIDSHVLRQLGEDLVTDAEQALLELVKNCYDADASYSDVCISTSEISEVNVRDLGKEEEERKERELKPQSKETNPPIKEHYKILKLIGSIRINDDGDGMSEDALRRGWLYISRSKKRQMKRDGQKTSKLRTPLGDKGLGRLSSMCLGSYIKITTFTLDEPDGHCIEFSWDDCREGLPLSKVPITHSVIVKPKFNKGGTKIEILGLKDPAHWRGHKQVNLLRLKLSQFISPFEPLHKPKESEESKCAFKVTLSIDTSGVQLITFNRTFLNTASSAFELLWDGASLELKASLKLELFRTTLKDPFFETMMASDKGKAFFNYLKTLDPLTVLNLVEGSGSWYICLSENVKKDLIFREESQENDAEPAADPGILTSEMFGFKLSNNKKSKADDDENKPLPPVLEDSQILSRLARYLAGIYVFRDKFRIRLGGDWLNLGGDQTTGASYYSLRPANVLGYVYVTAEDNPKLEETSDRESFKDTPEFRGFMLIMEKFREFANNCLDLTRSEYLLFKEKCCRPGTSPYLEPPEAIESLKEHVSKAKVVVDKIRSQKDTPYLPDSPQRMELNIETEAVLKSVAKSDVILYDLHSRINTLERRLTDMYEAAAIGIAAQGLVHEVHPFVEEVRQRLRKVSSKLRLPNYDVSAVCNELEDVMSHTVLIAKQIAYIEPMLRTFRESRKAIDIQEFLSNFFILRRERRNEHNVQYQVLNPRGISFKININQGKLIQVFDNLTRNSEYWINYKRESGDSSERLISAEVQEKSVHFYDTGSGVRRGIENSIFEPFVTDKPKGQGQGLGLFITTQLLIADGCSISLSPELNHKGRRFKFILDFTNIAS